MDDFAIVTEGLTKQYRGFLWRLKPERALDNLTLSVPRGTVFGFLGPNGAGKTTTIRCLMDLIRPSDGKAWVLGQECGDVAIRQRIGYLPDNPVFSPHLTAMQFLKLCARLLKIPRHVRRQRIDQALKDVEMTASANSPLRDFSRGMIQRIGIAQALLNEPDLLILDEPLVGLDPHGRKDLLEIVRKQKQRGACIFFCSHILSDVEKLCDAVGILREGRLLCSGPINELLGASGLLVHVPQEQEVLARELMMDAAASTRNDEGGWQLSFTNEKTVAMLKERSWPDGVTVEARREGLEDLFFRLTKQQESSDNG